MREILFHGKTKSGEWKFGYLFAKPLLKLFYILEGENQWMVDPETVGQYTEQPDKNGKKIFEGDILRGYFDSARKRVGVVVFDDGRWEVHSQSGSYIAELTEGYEVDAIGNIHDNPELLKEDE